MPFTDLTFNEYSDKSIVVYGDTRKYKEDLKKLGGKYNANLKQGPGWIFPKTLEKELNEFINTGKRIVTDAEIKEGEERSKHWCDQTNLKEKKMRVTMADINMGAPTLSEYAILVDLFKKMSVKLNYIEQAVLLLLNEKQIKELNKTAQPIINTNTTKNSPKSNNESVDDYYYEEETTIPRKRLMKK